MLLVFLFLMLPISKRVWDILPLLHYALFPWRFLSLAGIPLAFLSGFTINEINFRLNQSQIQRICVIFFCIVPILTVLPYLKMRQIPFSEQMVEKMNIWRTEIASKTYGTTMSNEYLPKDIKKMPILPAKNFMQATDGTQIDFTPIQYTSVQQEYRIDLP